MVSRGCNDASHVQNEIMSNAVTKQELLALMSQGLLDAEAAIANHPAATQSLYQEAKRGFLEGQAQSQETEWSRAVGLSLSELALMHQYLFASAFMSAWHHVHGDKKRRNAVTSSACLLVSGLGISPEDVLHRYMDYERFWRSSMRHGGIGTGRVQRLVNAIFNISSRPLGNSKAL
jgi:hypothetical protein